MVYEEERGERYRLLETVRQYALDRLMEYGEDKTLRRRHLEFFLGFAEGAEPELVRADQMAWLDRLEEEHDNLRAALAGCQAGNEAAEMGLRLAGSLWWFWLVRTYFTEGREWLEMAARSIDASASARAKVLHGAGYLARVQGQLERAKTLSEEALTLWREVGDKRGIARALNTLAFVAYAEDHDEQAREWCEQSLALWREVDDTWGIANSLEQLGLLAAGRRECERAKTLATESLGLFRELHDKRSIALSLWLLAWMAVTQEDYKAARSYFVQVLAIFQELKDKRNMSWVLSWIGRLAGYQGEPVRAARILGAAEVLCEAHGVSRLSGEKEEFERCVVAARASLSEEVFGAVWAEGRAMSLAEATQYALEDTDAKALR